MTDNLGMWPSSEDINAGARMAPMESSSTWAPYVMWWESALSVEQCEAISSFAQGHEPYSHAGCDAVTRELGDIPELGFMDGLARVMNDNFFGYDLHRGHKTWHQSYWPGASYQKHADQAPGISRKLTAILMLSDPTEYEGGLLQCFFEPMLINPPISRGTVIVIQPWLIHEVTPLTRGLRESINMGFYGPPFK